MNSVDVDLAFISLSNSVLLSQLGSIEAYHVVTKPWSPFSMDSVVFSVDKSRSSLKSNLFPISTDPMSFLTYGECYSWYWTIWNSYTSPDS